jgi:hypothetical protein
MVSRRQFLASEEDRMKAFFAGMLIALAIAGGTAALYGTFGISAAEYFSTPAVRLSG